LNDAEATAHPTLDDLYHMVAHIYGDKNIARTSTATFAHFAEVCGMLTIHARKKKREGINVTDALCKALGWYFPLLAKLRVRSVEDLIFRKFPGVCPYCREAPHNEANCKQVKGTNETVSHADVSRIYQQNKNTRPKRLDDWQAMFQRIYPRGVDDTYRSVVGLFEEVGELAEAVRVFEVHPQYFLGEAADTFSYLMGIANEHKIALSRDGVEFSLEREFIARYPGLCMQCGSRICICPSVPQATVGRMAKELAIGDTENLFVDDLGYFSKRGTLVAHQMLDKVGGYAGLAEQLPFDRGDTNRALMSLCLRIADAVEVTRPDFAATLRTEVIRLSSQTSLPGTARKSLDIQSLLDQIGAAWKDLSEEHRVQIKSSGDIVHDLAEILDAVRVLYVLCSPRDEQQLRVNGELRAIKEAIRNGSRGSSIKYETLPAATPQDLRRQLLREQYEIVHFSGHANADVLVFEDEHGAAFDVPLEAVAELLNKQKTIKCVVLNACDSVKNLAMAISPITIGMDQSIEDDAAVHFSTGFYDALAAGRSIEQSYEEGLTAVRMAGDDPALIKLLKR